MSWIFTRAVSKHVTDTVGGGRSGAFVLTQGVVKDVTPSMRSEPFGWIPVR
jgi:hypothetical protein